MKKEIHVAIHDLNQFGGQDRSTLEIWKRLAPHVDLKIHAFTVGDPELLKHTSIVSPNFRRPVIWKAIYFYLVLLFRELRAGRRFFWHTTGVSHIRSDVLHLQFLHKSWRACRTQAEGGGLLRRIYHDLLERFNIALENLCFREGKTYIAIAHCVARDLENHFGIRNNIHVVHHGVDPRLFSPLSPQEKRNSPIRKNLGIGAEERVAVFVGSYQRKGLETCLRAIAGVDPALRKDFNFVAVGDGDRERFEALARELGIENCVRIVGKQKGISAYFQMADLFLFPTQYEPFGLVILEALACGIPAIVSRCAGGSELMEEGRHGYLIENPVDHKEVAGLLARALRDPQALAKMGVEARALAERNSWDHVAEKYLKVLNGIQSWK
jgi:glycosyltransferase involved in cell wall biosynthesis